MSHLPIRMEAGVLYIFCDVYLSQIDLIQLKTDGGGSPGKGTGSTETEEHDLTIRPRGFSL